MNIDIKNIKEPLHITLEDGTVVTYNSKEDVPHSWKEFCEKHSNTNGEYYIDDYSCVKCLIKDSIYRGTKTDRNFCLTEEDAEAFLALMQLRRVWHDWCEVYGYPNWDDHKSEKYGIFYNHRANEFNNTEWWFMQHSGLVFTSKEVADQFIKDFKDLLNIAKPLL